MNEIQIIARILQALLAVSIVAGIGLIFEFGHSVV